VVTPVVGVLINVNPFLISLKPGIGFTAPLSANAVLLAIT